MQCDVSMRHISRSDARRIGIMEHDYTHDSALCLMSVVTGLQYVAHTSDWICSVRTDTPIPCCDCFHGCFTFLRIFMLTVYPISSNFLFDLISTDTYAPLTVKRLLAPALGCYI